MQRIHQVGVEHEGLLLDLDEIARAGARRMLAEALEAEAAREQRDEQGRALMVRNGYAREREVLLGAGSVALKAPRVNDKSPGIPLPNPPRTSRRVPDRGRKPPHRSRDRTR